MALKQSTTSKKCGQQIAKRKLENWTTKKEENNKLKLKFRNLCSNVKLM